MSIAGTKGTDEHAVPAQPHLAFIVTVPVSARFFRGQLEQLRRDGFCVRFIASPGPQRRRLMPTSGHSELEFRFQNWEFQLCGRGVLPALRAGSLFRAFPAGLITLGRIALLHRHVPVLRFCSGTLVDFFAVATI
jgi:hypothetical protein